MKIIIGLGNPEKKYQETRHNIGFQIIDELYNDFQEFGFSNWENNKKFQALISQGNYRSEKVLLVKPLTFMNHSGNSAQAIMHYYKCPPLDLIVVHDDLDLILGNYKIQKDISSAGHNGIKSIIEKLGTQMFYRVRIGIGRAEKSKQGDTASYVLNRFNIFERIKLKKVKHEIIERIKELVIG